MCLCTQLHVHACTSVHMHVCADMWAVSSFGLSCDPGCTNISCANIWILVFNSLGLETEKWSFWVTRQTYFWFVSA